MCRELGKNIENDSYIMYSGSITVFLTILFLLFFSLIGAAFENVRVLSSAGYLRTAAHSAAMTVFGDYLPTEVLMEKGLMNLQKSLQIF